MADAKLPLVARKNIKEYEEKVTEQKEKIQAAIEPSTDITIDFDYPTLHAFADKNGYQNRVGEVGVWLLEGLAGNLERQFKEETAKQALQANWSTGVIRFRQGTLKKGEYGYYKTDIENGDIVVTYYSISNVSTVGEDLLDKLTDANTGLSVKASQDMKEYEEKRTENMQGIHESTGLSSDVTLDVDWVLFSQKTDENGYKNRVGEAVNWYLEALNSQFKRIFEKDISKQAIQDAWTTGVIKIEWGTLKKGQYGYSKVEIRDGDLVVTVYSLSNVSETGSDLLESLVETASGLPVKTALDIKEYEEKKDEYLKEIQEAVGLSCDVTIEVDWTVINAKVVKDGYKDRAGEAIYSWVLGALCSNIKRLCGEELTKEALQEIWTTGVIRLEENKKISYHDVVFNNGDLIIQYNALCSNVSEIGSNIESKL